MSGEELRRLLVTCDGVGREAKTAALEAVLAERDDADRQAGAARRRVVQLEEQERVRDSWLRKAKTAAGYDDRVSFDVVWGGAALAALLASRHSSPAQSA